METYLTHGHDLLPACTGKIHTRGVPAAAENATAACSDATYENPFANGDPAVIAQQMADLIRPTNLVSRLRSREAARPGRRSIISDFEQEVEIRREEDGT